MFIEIIHKTPVPNSQKTRFFPIVTTKLLMLWNRKEAFLSVCIMRNTQTQSAKNFKVLNIKRDAIQLYQGIKQQV